ncbi:hypothetical protein EW145_g1947 [Phellinidium pouzarii]|uniref:Uncharacterized protein n=1 Tax=Phellinidium pouzarii TaxID=167371 RepID=A0A4S4LCK6_9AGAM|nr:hypothetical protein EW145_g1947 [Phellinidium pouzarii]
MVSHRRNKLLGQRKSKVLRRRRIALNRTVQDYIVQTASGERPHPKENTQNVDHETTSSVPMVRRESSTIKRPKHVYSSKKRLTRHDLRLGVQFPTENESSEQTPDEDEEDDKMLDASESIDDDSATSVMEHDGEVSEENEPLADTSSGDKFKQRSAHILRLIDISPDIAHLLLAGRRQLMTEDSQKKK